jgi:hypothetical protein
MVDGKFMHSISMSVKPIDSLYIPIHVPACKGCWGIMGEGERVI